MKKRKIKKTLIHAFLFVLSPTRLNLYLGFKNTKKITYQRVQETFHELIR